VSTAIVTPALASAQVARRQPISPSVDRRISDRLLWVPDTARRNKIHIMAESGAGKSRFLGRVLAWLLFLRRTPQVILDPTGGTVMNLLDKVIRLPRSYQEHLWPRLRYVDMSGGGGYVVPFPLYHRMAPSESLFDVSQRFLEVVRRMDVHLEQAPVLGLNALVTVGTYTGMILTALGCQITEASDLIRHPDRWMNRISHAAQDCTELKPAVDFYREFADQHTEERTRHANTLMAKLLPFIADPKMRAMFGAPEPGVDWSEMVAKGWTVCLDFSSELNAERRRFKLLWAFRSLVDFFKLRSFQGRDQRVSMIIDELTQLLGFGSQEHSVMAEDIEELISVVARNYGVDLTIAHQNLPQIGSERIQKALMTMGTQMIGVQTDPYSAQYLAEYFHRYDPYRVKRYEPVWMSVMHVPMIIDQMPVEFTPEEQRLLNSYTFMDLGRFRFLVRAPRREGEMRARFRRVSIARLDAGVYPDNTWVSQAREQLMKRRGLSIKDALQEIDSRRSVSRPIAVRVPQPELTPVPSLWGE